jgi:hypothetical protein
MSPERHTPVVATDEPAEAAIPTSETFTVWPDRAVRCSASDPHGSHRGAVKMPQCSENARKDRDYDRLLLPRTELPSPVVAFDVFQLSSTRRRYRGCHVRRTWTMFRCLMRLKVSNSSNSGRPAAPDVILRARSIRTATIEDEQHLSFAPEPRFAFRVYSRGGNRSLLSLSSHCHRGRSGRNRVFLLCLEAIGVDCPHFRLQ